jgi:hypothetical protein
MKLFDKLYYLTYPFSVLALIYALQPFIDMSDSYKESFGNGLVFLGLSQSFGVLKDDQKISSLEKKIIEKSFLGMMIYWAILIIIICGILLGTIGFILSKTSEDSSLAIGVITAGIGFLANIKQMTELIKKNRPVSQTVS